MYYLIDIFLHIDQHLINLTLEFGSWIYLILFLVIFCETGLVVMPFLPGDSLLFALGAFTALPNPILHQSLIVPLLMFACFLGNQTNYLIGKAIGGRIFEIKNSFFFNKRSLEKAHAFYEKNGAKTIIIARFLPLIRTFVPFVAGISKMNFMHFSLYSICSGLFWVGSLFYLGYFFGSLSLVKNHFSAVIYLIIAISLLPALTMFLISRARRSAAFLRVRLSK